jgi:hypothetical protein
MRLKNLRGLKNKVGINPSIAYLTNYKAGEKDNPTSLKLLRSRLDKSSLALLMIFSFLYLED